MRRFLAAYLLLLLVGLALLTDVRNNANIGFVGHAKDDGRIL